MARIPAVISPMGIPSKAFGGEASSSLSLRLAKSRSAMAKPTPEKQPKMVASITERLALKFSAAEPRTAQLVVMRGR